MSKQSEAKNLQGYVDKVVPKTRNLFKAKYKTDGSTILRVLPSELLGLCYEIEEGLTAIQCDKYIEELKEIIRRNITKMGESAKCVHASVEQRIEALAKVKGIEV